MKTKIRVGISGWRYAPWRGRFYPARMPQSMELSYAASVLSTVEINGSFYSLQRATSYASWDEQTPRDFVFALKGPRYITHMLRLKDARIPLANFFASGPLTLGKKLGPILWQLPPTLIFDPARLESFLDLLPSDTKAAKALARAHDGHVERSSSIPGGSETHKLRHAFEVRHPSFVDPSFIRMMKERRHAIVVADTAGRFPVIEEVTADFVYIRLHGDQDLYASGYSEQTLARWSRRIRDWSRHEVFCYFDNDVKVHAPFDAMRLAEMLHVGKDPVRDQ
jgi:uncharacterized protein YecE (DUF72 family)